MKIPTALRSSFENKHDFIRLPVCLLIIIASYIWLTSIIKSETIVDRWDPLGYSQLSKQIYDLGLARYYDPLRTYGYPLFLAGLRWIADKINVNWVNLVCTIQFIIHTATALLVLWLTFKLMPDKPRAPIIGFVLIQLNPILLELTRQVLSDSLSVFVVTLFLWALFFRRYGIASAALGAAIVIRPFHQVWSIAFLVSIALCFVVQQIAIHGLRSAFSKLVISASKISIYKGFKILIPLILIVGLQVIFVYRAEGRIAVAPGDTENWQTVHLARSVYQYKYETSNGTQHGALLDYISSSRKAIAINYSDPFQYILEDPVGEIHMVIVKTIGLFQSYEYSLYRTTLNNYPTVPFWWGLLTFCLFIYIHQSALLKFRWKAIFSSRIILLLAIDSYVFLYSIFTVPESRDIASIIPVLTVAGLYVAFTSRHWRRLLLAAVVATAMYIMAYEIIISSLI